MSDQNNPQENIPVDLVEQLAERLKQKLQATPKEALHRSKMSHQQKAELISKMGAEAYMKLPW